MDKYRRRELKQQAKESAKRTDYILNEGGYPRAGLLMLQALEPGADSLSDPDYLALWLKQVFDAMFPSAEPQQKVDIHSADPEGDTVLHCACRWGDVRAVRLLLEAGADVHAVGDMEQTPLHCAVSGRFADVVEILLSYGADADRKDLFGYTPREWATQMEFEDISAILALR